MVNQKKTEKKLIFSVRVFKNIFIRNTISLGHGTG
ncbi:hypothetical protein FLACOL7796_01350 [Flavobacterium collinsii]|jgi:hypothetical protein|uniref:Uncharacterized protein n=1 Tax=Flavobacterium collinsii TaxID=1114861 RepID=A0ABN7EH07_9FLAO|nr:hypothetical protein FLACOL7796_01350 [Flavobacterium collinsii]